MTNLFDHSSIAGIHEADLIKQLLADVSWPSRIVRQRGIPDDAIAFQGVPLAGLSTGVEGDIDILLCSPNRPDLATAIEVKRVKVGPNALRSGEPNRLRELNGGVRQANLHAKIGFSQVYLYVFVVVDSRSETLKQDAWAGSSPGLRERISNAVSVTGLHDRVGLFHHQFIQWEDYAPLGVGGYFGHLIRPAQPETQPPELTQWVADVAMTRTGISLSNGVQKTSQSPRA